MWKLLPVLFLVGCAATEPQKPANSNDQSTQGRIVRQFELSVETIEPTVDEQPVKKTFQRSGLSGWLEETGAWHIRAEVQHGRLLCGTYQVGAQPGRGIPDCANVTWLSDVEYVSRQMHCNNAALPHAGEGKFSDLPNRFEEVTCVRVVIRCQGNC